VEAHRVCERVETREQAVTTVIYAAGVSQRAFLLEAGEEVVDRVLAVNFRSAVTVARRLGRRMAAAGRGRIAVVSSLAAYAPTPLRSIYSASKSALGVMAASLRAEVAASGVGVTLVVPGFVRTAISESALRADGAAYGVIDPNQAGGMDAGACARQIIRGVEAGRDEVWVALGFKGRLALALGRIAPRLQRRLLAKVPTSAAEA
jgi:short-subunit dehydrogenase